MTTAGVYYQYVGSGFEQFLFQSRTDDSGDNQARSFSSVHRSFMLNSSQQANFKTTTAGAITCYQDSYILPDGM